MRETKFRYLGKNLEDGTWRKAEYTLGEIEAGWPSQFTANDNLKKEELLKLQYTGLKDKNSKEIYEGDILNVNWSTKNDSQDSEWKQEIHKAIIEWRRNGWFVSWSYFSRPFDMDGNKEICWYEDYNRCNDPGSFQKLTDLEIIGNIYENPSLLKQENQ